MDIATYVFIRSIVNTPTGVIAEAGNGDPETGPFVRFEVPHADVTSCHIGKKYRLVVDEEET